MQIALYIGRFQPFHNGHLWAVKKILKDCERVIIGIGSSQYRRTATNPYSAAERKEMIRACLTYEGIDDYCIFEVPDIHSDGEWVNHVKTIIPKFDVIYTGSQLTKELFEKSGIQVKILSRHRGISASEVRLRIKNNSEWKELIPAPVAEVISHISLKLP